MIAQKVPCRKIAAKTGLSESAIYRHKAHVRQAVALAQEKTQVTNGMVMVEQFLEMWNDAVKEYQNSKTSAERAMWFREKRGLFDTAAKLGLQAQQAKQAFADVSPAVEQMIEEVVK